MENAKKPISLVLALVLALSAFFVVCAGAVVDASAAAGDVIYFKKPASWNSVYCYVWEKDGEGSVAWPGTEMTDEGDDIYSFTMPGNENMVIFNNNSGSQTADLTFQGGDMLFTPSSDSGNGINGNWEPYETGPVKFTSFGTSLESPQYKDTQINIFASAESENGSAIEYQFSVSGAESRVLQNYSSSTNVYWSPAVAGEYVITVTARDAQDNEVSRSMDYTIKDDATESRPVLKGITPAGGSTVQTGQRASVDVIASGGMTGTNLLFYKVAITQQSTQQVVNGDVYYSLNDTYSFTPAQDGTYNVTVYVQNSSNITVSNTYELFATSSAADLLIQSFTSSKTSPINAGDSVTFTAQATGGTEPYEYQFAVNNVVQQSYSSKQTFDWTANAGGTYTIAVTARDAEGKTATTDAISITVLEEEYILGDADGDGKVTLIDAILIQRASIGLVTLTNTQMKAADFDQNGTVELQDALMVQKRALAII